MRNPQPILLSQEKIPEMSRHIQQLPIEVAQPFHRSLGPSYWPGHNVSAQPTIQIKLHALDLCMYATGGHKGRFGRCRSRSWQQHGPSLELKRKLEEYCGRKMRNLT